MAKKRVIVITDGDQVARRAVETAAKNVNARCISVSGGRHPEEPPLTADQLVAMVLSAPADPVVVMVDDGGKRGKGWGEKVLAELLEHREIEVMGVIAVASHLAKGESVPVDSSVDRHGAVVAGSVDKEGQPQGNGCLYGDTVGVLRKLKVPVVIGLGDPGKMDFHDDVQKGAPVTTKALQTVMEKYAALKGG
ncbi:MAG TPA: stage V sporulation protein AE [Firmicutes bacterium]|nr:stage V sporulation protein AE [Bacillota bacterium]